MLLLIPPVLFAFALTDIKLKWSRSNHVVLGHSTYHKLSQQFHVADHVPGTDRLCPSFLLFTGHLCQHSRKTLQDAEGERRERERGGKEELHLNGAMKSKVRMIKSSPLNQATPQKRSLVCYHCHYNSCCALVTIQTATNL